MTEQPEKVRFESDMDVLSYDLERPDMRPAMLEKIAKNVAKFGSLEGWLQVFRQELWQKRMAADRAVNIWWTNQKQMEFLERFALTSGTEELPGVDPITLRGSDGPLPSETPRPASETSPSRQEPGPSCLQDPCHPSSARPTDPQ